jgi:hypothetical protein
MKMKFEIADALPKLAWHASVNFETKICHVEHGPWVELFTNGFIEGVWDAAFSDFSFSSSACIFGSGAIIENDHVIFISSTSTTDCLYYSTQAKTMEISNSLPLLLASIGDELDPHCTQYPSINESVINGINRYIQKIPTKNKFVTRLIHRNLVVSRQSIEEVEKPLEPHFDSYDTYFRYVDGRYRKIVENALDHQRKRPMEIFSTQSKGYDSTAVNSIAKNYHIDKVFTITKGKAKGYYMNEGLGHEPDDDGTEIGNIFGMNCISLDRHDVKKNEMNEHLVYATIHESGDINLLPIVPYVEKPTVLLTGCLGEIWYTEKYYTDTTKLNADLVRGDLGNHGITEARLQAGYVQLAFPFIGARSRADIFAITMSNEMAPWRLNNSYDRPIARRMAEVAGLPRMMLGQVKMASIVELPTPILPLCESLRRDFLEYLILEGFLTRWKLLLLPLARKWNAIVMMTSPRRHLWNYYLQRLISKFVRRDFYFSTIWPEINGQLFCYCVNQQMKKYRGAQMLKAKQNTKTENFNL